MTPSISLPELPPLELFCSCDVPPLPPIADKILIELQIIRPDNLQKTTFVYIWDKTLSTIIIGSSGSGLQENLQFQNLG